MKDDELERLAEEYMSGWNPARPDVLIVGFKAGFKAAEKLFKERWPSPSEIEDTYFVGESWGREYVFYNWLQQKLFGGGE
jgi:hypothetical protein